MKKVLVIDDDSAILSVVEKFFKILFTDIILLKTTDGKKGVDLAVAKNPNVIIVDIFMPGMDGYEVCEKIKNNPYTCDIPVIFLSSVNNIGENKEKAIEKGADAFLSKPIDKLELTLQIRAMFKINEANIKDRTEKKSLQEQVNKKTSILRKELAERKKIENALRESEERFKKISNISSDYAYSYTLEENGVAKLDWHFGAFRQITGYPPFEDIGENDIVKLIHPDDLEKVVQRNAKLCQGEKVITELRIITKSDELKWIREKSVPEWDTKKQKVIRVVSTAQEITERKEAEKIQRETEQTLQVVLENIPFAVFAHDVNGKFIFANGAAVKYSGYSRKELLALNVSDIDKETISREYRESIWFKLKFGETQKIFSTHFRKDGTSYPVEIDVAAIYYKNNKIFVAIVQDITDRNKAEKLIKENELKLKELNATKDKFFSIIAHDLKAPFSGILGFSNLLYERSKEGDFKNIEYMTGLLNKAAIQSFDLLNNLLEWSRTQTGKKEFNPVQTNLCKIVTDTINLMSLAIEEKSLRIEINCPERIAIYADPNMLNTIFRNLLSNAIKYSYTNGTIKISVLEKDSEFQLSVEDNGTGISSEIQNKLFKIGEDVVTLGTNEEKGTGLGLILCKEFVELHGGKIWVDSSINSGTKFTFNIPKK